MLFDYLHHTNQFNNSCIDEKIDYLTLSIKPDISISDFFPKLFDELKTISTRDSFELFIEIEGTNETITNCSNACYEKIKNHINGFDRDAEFDIELRVKKNLSEKTMSVYFIDEFSNYLNNTSEISLINLISKYFEKSLTFEVFSKIKIFGSKSIKFIEANTKNSLGVASDLSLERNKKLSLLFDNVTTSNFSLELIPEDFYLVNESECKNINSIFSKMSSLLSMIFISNSSSFESDGSFFYKISGYKSISEKIISVDYDRKKCEILYKIYAWSYEGGNSSDKLGLVRNVFSIHLDTDNKIKIDNEVWQAIQSNYQIYLKENIQSYLDIKNKIGEFLIESSSRTYTLADEILSSFKNNIFVFITFFLTVVVINGLKDTGSKSIFSDVYLAIVIILCAVSLVWREMSTRQIIKQFESASSTVKQILQLNYSKVLMQDEIDKCIDPVISINRIYLEKQVKIYSKWWFCIVFVVGLMYVLANLYFEHPNLLGGEVKENVNPDKKQNTESPE